MIQSTRTHLRFAHLGNGAMIAQYRTSNAIKVSEIRAALTLLGYTSKVTPLLHTNQHLITVTVGNNVKKDAYEGLRVDFKAMWRSMRAEQKATGATVIGSSFDGEPDTTVED